MGNSKVKDILKKDGFAKALEFIRKNIRYFAAGVLFILLVLVLVKFTGPKPENAGDNLAVTEIQTESEEPFEVDAHPEINDLVAQYYTAYANNDLTTLSCLAMPVSLNELSYISMFSQYVEEYRNIKCYTKVGAEAGSYLVSVSMEIKFAGVDTTAPGLDFFYIRTNESGGLYIDNLYCQYNLTNQENALDTGVQNLINKYENESDVVELQQTVQGQYDTAVASDENLSVMIQTTIPNAIADWIATAASQSTETPEEPQSEAPEEPQSETPEEPQSETQEEQPEQTNETLYATDRVNVRASADTSSEKLGSVELGATVTRTGTEGEWSIIDYNGTPGYIKSEYLTADASSLNAGQQEDATGGITAGTVVMLSNTTNIRSGMSETSDRVGTAYAGEKVTVVMSYAEGWTKVSWNNKTGYVKTSLLQ